MLAARTARRAALSGSRRMVASLGGDVRVRYAPSPTGFLHLGGLRTALFNYLFARRHGGQFVLRIEDTDQSRKVDGAVEDLIAMLKWCGVHHDEGPDCGGPVGPYVQSERLDMYNEAVAQLLETGHAYRCFCSADRLQALRERQARVGAPSMYDRHCLHLPAGEAEARAAAGEPHTVRLQVPRGTTVVEDAVRRHVSFSNSAIDDQVLLKSDGFPTYHLACVVDDHHMQISHVLRGEEWLSSTPKHALLYRALGWQSPVQAHLPLLLNADRTKLSKRQGDVAVEDFKARGFLPSALVNFVAFLGWSPASEVGEAAEEVMRMEQLVEQFSLDRVHTSGAVVDADKLAWFNGQHIRMRCAADAATEEMDSVARQAEPHVAAASARAWSRYAARGGCREAAPPAAEGGGDVGVGAEWGRVRQVVRAVHERVRMFEDFGPAAYFFFAPPCYDDEQAVAALAKAWKGQETADVLQEVGKRVAALGDDAEPAQYAAAVKQAAKARGVKPGAAMMPVRLAVTATPVGADLGTTLALVGKERVASRIQDFLEWKQGKA